MNSICIRLCLAAGVIGAAVGSGCVGRREAVLANQALKTNSVAAVQTITRLQGMSQKEVAAHRATRRHLQAALTNAAAAHRAARLQEATAALQKSHLDIQTANCGLLIRLAALRRDKAADLENAIDAALRPLQAKADALRSKAQSAFKDFAAAPKERAFREAHIDADKDYLTVQGLILDTRLDALKAGLNEINVQEADARGRLAGAAAKQMDAATQIYHTNVAVLPGGSAWLPDLGPEPAVPDAGFAALKDYAENVGKAADENLNYLRSNALGRGSFFADFLSSAGRGATTAILSPAARGTDPSALLKDATSLGKDVLDELKVHLGEAAAAFRTEGGSILTEATTAMGERAKAAAEVFVKEKIRRIEDRKNSDTDATNSTRP